MELGLGSSSSTTSSNGTQAPPFQKCHTTSTRPGLSQAPRVKTCTSIRVSSGMLATSGRTKDGASRPASDKATSTVAENPNEFFTFSWPCTCVPAGCSAATLAQTSAGILNANLSMPLDSRNTAATPGLRHTECGASQVHVNVAGIPPRFSVSPANTRTSPQGNDTFGTVSRGMGTGAPGGACTVMFDAPAGRRMSASPRRTKVSARRVKF
mmetsp:Transcript_71448/g.190498  ORF Transcript_71448/g.190498 Transcript_71448/m.190498 type:complete len:211 (+) Transcript_71448:3256-3888(+)